MSMYATPGLAPTVAAGFGGWKSKSQRTRPPTQPQRALDTTSENQTTHPKLRELIHPPPSPTGFGKTIPVQFLERGAGGGGQIENDSRASQSLHSSRVDKQAE